MSNLPWWTALVFLAGFLLAARKLHKRPTLAQWAIVAIALGVMAIVYWRL